MSLNEPLYVYGGKVGIYIKNAFSYVSYKSYDFWSSRYKPFGVSYRSFLDNYSIDPDDIYFTIYNHAPRNLALRDIDINITLLNVDAPNDGNLEYDPTTDAGYYINNVFVHAVEKQESVENNIRGFKPINNTNFVHTINNTDPNYYMSNCLPFPRTLVKNLDAPTARLALDDAYYEIEFSTQALSINKNNKMQIIIEITLSAGILSNNIYTQKSVYQHELTLE